MSEPCINPLRVCTRVVLHRGFHETAPIPRGPARLTHLAVFSHRAALNHTFLTPAGHVHHLKCIRLCIDPTLCVWFPHAAQGCLVQLTCACWTNCPAGCQKARCSKRNAGFKGTPQTVKLIMWQANLALFDGFRECCVNGRTARKKGGGGS